MRRVAGKVLRGTVELVAMAGWCWIMWWVVVVVGEGIQEVLR